MKRHIHKNDNGGGGTRKDCIYSPDCTKTLPISSLHTACRTCRDGLAYWEPLPLRRRLERSSQLTKLQARMATVNKGKKK